VIVTSSGASNSPLTVPVTLTVSAPASTITLSANSLTFSGTATMSAPPFQTVNVTSSAASSVSIATGGGQWLAASLSSSTTPATITISANQANLAAGTYGGVVVITAPGNSNSPLAVNVRFVVSQATNLTVAPTDMSFVYMVGGATPASQSLTITANQSATVQTSVAGASWVSLSSSSVNTPSTITVNVSPGSLPVGTYQAAISITSSGAANSPQVVPVTLIISDKGMLASSPSSLTFTTTAGGSNPGVQSINLTASATAQFTLAKSASWLNVSASSNSTPATLTVSANSSGMPQGVYQGSITISSGTATNSPMTIPVTLSITKPLVTSAPTINTVVNGASYDMNGFAPGSIVSIFGNLLGPQTGTVFSLDGSGTLAGTLGGVTVTVNGIAATPLFVQNGQINAILPFNLGTSGQATVEVQYNDQTSVDFNIPLVPSDVQLFTANASGSGPGSILNQDYSVNTAKNPAAPGSTIMVYAAGAGTVTPAVAAGDVAGDKLSMVTLPYLATVNGEPANVVYAGTAPSLLYGVYQFNIQLPADLPAGAQKIVVTVGDSSSQSDVTVYVK